MLFKVVPTHVKGIRRPKADMATAEQFMGELTISTLETSSAGRPDLVGYQIEPHDGAAVEVVQGWWAKALPDPQGAL